MLHKARARPSNSLSHGCAVPAPSKRELRLWAKSYSPPFGGRIALSANERIAEFLDFAIQAKFAYVNKL